MTGVLRWCSRASAVALAMVLLGCAGGSGRPKPAELKPLTTPVVGVRQAWVAKLPEISFPLQLKAIGNQVILASDDGAVVTLDAVSGQEISRVAVGAPLAGGVGSDGRTAAVVTRTNEVVAVAGGHELWRHKLSTQSYTAPLVAGGRVFVLGADRSLTALDGRTGAKIWHIRRTAEPLVLRQAGVLMAVRNTLVAGVGGRMIGVNPDDGQVFWEAPVASARGTNDVERLVDLIGGVNRQGDLVCARAFQTAVGCVDTLSGTVRWSRSAHGATGISGDEQRIYGTESDGRVLAWRVDTGERAWAVNQLQWRVLTGTLVLGRSVVFGDSTGWVHMLSRQDGRVLNRLMTHSSGVAATPVVADNTLVVVTHNGNVYGFVPE